MSELLIDNDIFFLLSAAGVMDEVISIFNVDSARIYVLPTLKNVGAVRGWIGNQYSEEHLQSVLSESQKDRYQGVLTCNPQRVAEIQQQNNIDRGEATLLVKLSEGEGMMLLATKDTRFVGALAESDIEEKIVANGKIVLLEHVLALMYEQFGYGYISEHFMPCVDYDRRLCAILGTTGNVASFVEGLTSYIRKDIELYGNLLREFPVVEMPDA